VNHTSASLRTGARRQYSKRLNISWALHTTFYCIRSGRTHRIKMLQIGKGKIRNEQSRGKGKKKGGKKSMM